MKKVFLVFGLAFIISSHSFGEPIEHIITREVLIERIEILENKIDELENDVRYNDLRNFGLLVKVYMQLKPKNISEKEWQDELQKWSDNFNKLYYGD